MGGLAQRNRVRPAAWNQLQHKHKAGKRAGNVEEHLDNVCPNDSRHPAFKCVEKGEADNYGNASHFDFFRIEKARQVGAYYHRNHQRNGENPYAFRQGTQHQEDAGGKFADVRTEAAAHQLISGENFAPEIVGQQEKGNDDAAEKVAEDQLQKSEIAFERNAWRPNNRQSAGFSRDNRERNRPPWCAPATEEVILDGSVTLLESGSKPRNEDQVANDHRQVCYAHGKVDDSMRVRLR